MVHEHLTDDEIIERGLWELMADTVRVYELSPPLMKQGAEKKLETELEKLIAKWAQRFMMRPEVAAEVRGETLSPFQSVR